MNEADRAGRHLVVGWSCRRTSTWPGRTAAPHLESGSHPGPRPALRKTWHGRRSCPQPGRTDRAEDRGETASEICGHASPAHANWVWKGHLVSWHSLRPTSWTHHKVNVSHHLIVEHDGVPAGTVALLAAGPQPQSNRTTRRELK